MTTKVVKNRSSLPFADSLFPLNIEGRYTRDTLPTRIKSTGLLLRCGRRTMRITPEGELIFKADKRAEGTLITHLNNNMQRDVVVMFTYFGRHYSIQTRGGEFLIREEYQSDLVSNFVTSTQNSTI